MQIAKKNKGKVEDVIDFPSYNYAQAARIHVTCTQPFNLKFKRARQVCQCMASAGLTSNL